MLDAGREAPNPQRFAAHNTQASGSEHTMSGPVLSATTADPEWPHAQEPQKHAPAAQPSLVPATTCPCCNYCSQGHSEGDKASDPWQVFLQSSRLLYSGLAASVRFLLFTARLTFFSKTFAFVSRRHCLSLNKLQSFLTGPDRSRRIDFCLVSFAVSISGKNSHRSVPSISRKL